MDIFHPPHNCWKVASAHRAAVIIDGEDYFRALHLAMRQARRSIMIVGWDLHSELRLLRNGDNGGYPEKLGELLDALARERKKLGIYLMNWDFSMIYAMEREFFPRYNLKWRRHRRIHFCLDGEHPAGASQHQKVVVIDDAVAFSGGFDLAKQRWDTSGHEPGSRLRIDPDGIAYRPYHDVQMLVDGEAAAALGELTKYRWERACGYRPAISREPQAGDPWPTSVEPDFTQTRVAIARTLPAYNHYPPVREVERLYLDSIAAAKSFIYIENQYFSSLRVGKALAGRLQEPGGPEVVMVMPRRTSGWLEQHTMDVLRGRLMERLRQADVHGRLRAYYPRLDSDPGSELMVHTKLMVIDDTFLRVGSSNLSNRSLGLDSECDMALAAAGGAPESLAIGRIKNRLLAEHLGTGEEAVARAVANTGSLIAAIELLRGRDRSLEQMDCAVPGDIDQWVPEAALLDPEEPLEPQAFLDYLVSPYHQPAAYRNILKILVAVAALLGLAAVWRWTPLRQWLDIRQIIAAAAWVESMPLSPLLVMAGFVLGGFLSLPLTLMIIATVIIFGPFRGVIYSLAGAELSAMIMFFAGRRLGREVVARFGGSMLNRLNRRLSEAGLLAVVTFRIIPVAPFSVVNMVAGISKLRPRDFALGSIIGMIPGAIAIAFVADRIVETLRSPDTGHLAVAFAAMALAAAAMVWLRSVLRRRKKPAAA